MKVVTSSSRCFKLHQRKWLPQWDHELHSPKPGFAIAQLAEGKMIKVSLKKVNPRNFIIPLLVWPSSRKKNWTATNIFWKECVSFIDNVWTTGHSRIKTEVWIIGWWTHAGCVCIGTTLSLPPVVHNLLRGVWKYNLPPFVIAELRHREAIGLSELQKSGQSPVLACAQKPAFQVHLACFNMRIRQVWHGCCPQALWTSGIKEAETQLSPWQVTTVWKEQMKLTENWGEREQRKKYLSGKEREGARRQNAGLREVNQQSKWGERHLLLKAVTLARISQNT